MQNDIPELDKKGLRQFGLITGTIFIVLFGLIFPFIFNFSIPTWPFVLGGILITWALIIPSSLNPVYKAWMKLGGAIGWVMNRVVLFIVFYLLFFPVSLIMKLVSYDPMNRKLDKTADTYRINTKLRDSSHIKRPY